MKTRHSELKKGSSLRAERSNLNIFLFLKERLLRRSLQRTSRNDG